MALTGAAEQVRAIGSNIIVARSFGDVSRGLVKMRTSGTLQQPNRLGSMVEHALNCGGM